MARVLSNLFINAAQAMAAAGRITVEAERAGEGTRVRVRDDGPGIPDDVRPRVFEALFTTRSKGTGLGLALCRRIVEAHGGTIVLEPASPAQHPADPLEPGEPAEPPGPVGASFLLSFPPVRGP
jgi:signal transduction histidine kinase